MIDIQKLKICKGLSIILEEEVEICAGENQVIFW